MGPQGSLPVRSRSVRLWRRVRLRDILRRRFFDGDRDVGCGTSRDSSGACCRPFGSGAASQLVAGATFAEPLGQCLDGRPSHDCGREVHLRPLPSGLARAAARGVDARTDDCFQHYRRRVLPLYRQRMAVLSLCGAAACHAYRQGDVRRRRDTDTTLDECPGESCLRSVTCGCDDGPRSCSSTVRIIRPQPIL